MLKLAGILLILAGCVGYGSALCRFLKEHLQMLLTFKEILLEIEAQRSYAYLPYPQILQKCKAGKPKIYAEILQEASEQMEQNEEADVKKIFAGVVKQREKELRMLPEEVELVIELFRSLKIEGEGKKISEMYFKQLEEKITQAMTEKKEKQKLYQSISVMAGIFFIILLF